MSEIKYVNIDDNDFWQILFEEAYIEGQQSVRIRDALKNISTSEKEIIRKPMERIVKRIKEKAGSIFQDKNKGNQFVFLDDINVIFKEEGGIE